MPAAVTVVVLVEVLYDSITLLVPPLLGWAVSAGRRSRCGRVLVVVFVRPDNFIGTAIIGVFGLCVPAVVVVLVLVLWTRAVLPLTLTALPPLLAAAPVPLLVAVGGPSDS